MLAVLTLTNCALKHQATAIYTVYDTHDMKRTENIEKIVNVLAKKKTNKKQRDRRRVQKQKDDIEPTIEYWCLFE